MRDVDNKIKMIIEGILLAAGKPVSLDEMIGVFSEEERPDKAELRQVLDAIREDCNDRGFELREVASGFRFQVKQEISEWIARLWEEKPARYSRALLETLALIAYRQPITRGEIEDVRGVAVSSSIMKTLLEREWVYVVGHRDVPGRPAMYGTTRQFLNYFSLNSLGDLPSLAELRDLSAIGKDLQLDLSDIPGILGESANNESANNETDTDADTAAEELSAVEPSDDDNVATLH